MMAYADGFVVTILHNGKTIREVNSTGDRVARLPFGSEYALRIQNKTKKRAYVSVSIDGTDVLSGKLVMQAGQKIDLERFCLDGDLSKGNKFKFVEAANSAVQDPTSEDNGNVVVTFEPELVMAFATITGSSWHASIGKALSDDYSYKTFVNSAEIGNTVYGASNSVNSAGSALTSASLGVLPQVTADVGATVEGGTSSQKFSHTNECFLTETPVKIGIRLKGMVQEQVKPWSINFGPEPKISNNGVTLGGVKEIQFTASEAIVFTAASKIRIPLDQVKIS